MMEAMTNYPELAIHDDDDSRPLHGNRRRRLTQIVVLLCVLGLVLPTILTTVGVSTATADRACQVTVATLVPDAGGSRSGFELFGEGGPGWQCYSLNQSGAERHLAPLGFLPGVPSGIVRGQQS